MHKNLAKIGRVVAKTRSRTDKHTQTHRHLIALLRCSIDDVGLVKIPKIHNMHNSSQMEQHRRKFSCRLRDLQAAMRQCVSVKYMQNYRDRSRTTYTQCPRPAAVVFFRWRQCATGVLHGPVGLHCLPKCPTQVYG